MKTNHLKILVPGIFAATALALAVSAGAQTPPPAAPPPATKSPQAATMTGHHKGSAATAKHDADMKTMKTQCEAMMATKQEMQDKLVEHKQYICQHGQDLPEIRQWTWAGG